MTPNDIPVLRTPLEQVREFHETYGLPIADRQAFLPDEDERLLRYSLLREEWREYQDAEEADSVIEIADALGDMVCVIYGTALSYGIDLDAVVAEIHRSNMTKERDPSMTYPAKNVVKGPGFSPPDIAAAIGWGE